MKYITDLLYRQEKAYPIITAHSGCEGTPDNSLEHIRTAIASGAECLEIDVHEHNGTLYLTHDAQGNYEGCPTLAQCYELVAADSKSTAAPIFLIRFLNCVTMSAVPNNV